MAERQCRGTASVPREGMPLPDSPTPERGHCSHCGKDVALTISGHVRAHRPAVDTQDTSSKTQAKGHGT